MDMLDEILQVSSDTAIATARRLAVSEGVFVGISAGAAVAAALQVCLLIDIGINPRRHDI